VWILPPVMATVFPKRWNPPKQKKSKHAQTETVPIRALPFIHMLCLIL
jgi:hypothetical protein